MAERKLVKMYSSKTLGFTIHQYFYAFWGFKCMKRKEPFWLPVTDLNQLVIKLKGVGKNLTVKELQTYIKVCMKNADKNISKEACKFFNKYQRLCTL